MSSQPLASIGFVVLFVLVLSSAFAPAMTRSHWLREPIQQDLKGLSEDGLPMPPGSLYPLGSDSLGRDVFSRVVHGGRVSLTVGVSAMLTATIIGLLVGVISGYYGGKWDLALMRLTEINMTIPPILLAVAFAGLMDGKQVLRLHPSFIQCPLLDFTLKPGMVSIFIIIGLVCWPGMARVIRAQVMVLKHREFVLAARALGASDSGLVWRHVLPNLLPTVVVLGAMTTANTILLEASLGYLGIGVPPPSPTWGAMISEGQSYFIAAPHIVIVPGLAIVISVLAFNLLGQGLQNWIAEKSK